MRNFQMPFALIANVTPETVMLGGLLNDFEVTTAPEGLISSTLNSGGFANDPPPRSVSAVTPTTTLGTRAVAMFAIVNEMLFALLTGIVRGFDDDGFGVAVELICVGTESVPTLPNARQKPLRL